jgi:hypothetical protein
MSDKFKGLFGDDLASAYLGRIEAELGVSVNNAVLRQLTGQPN